MKKLKKAYYIVLAFLTTFCLISFSDNTILSEIFTNMMVSADEYNNFTYSINNGNASISKYNGKQKILLYRKKLMVIKLLIFTTVHLRVISTLRRLRLKVR